MFQVPIRFAFAVGFAALWANPLLAGAGSNDGAEVGLDDLIKRLGLENIPTGAGVTVGQVEATDGQGDYSPNQGFAEFNGKTFFEMSGATGVSNHATNVARDFYGNTISIAPGISEIYLWHALHWATNGYLHATGPSSTPPKPTPDGLSIFNHSWVGTFGSTSLDNAALRRADFAAGRDDVLMVAGVNNGNPNYPLLSVVYNGMSVGKTNRNHQSGGTLPGNDGPGRMKPEIVAPGNVTSWTTPVAAAAAALMIETARTTPGLGDNPNAQRIEVIKAVLLAGAAHVDAHDNDWSNNPETSGPNRGVTSQPIDDVVGVGTVNVNISHLILTGVEQDGSDAPPASVNAQHTGWDLAAVGVGESRFWRFDVAQPAEEISILVTGHRQTNSTFSASFVADFDLILWRVDKDGQLATLVGDAGLPFFAGGNVVSESPVDNIEHLYILDLQRGEYVLELLRLDNLLAYPQWDAAVAWFMPAPTAIPGDLDGDGTVGILDLLTLLAVWGPCADCENCPADLDGDCTVGILDLLALLANWG
ncbi:MAG: hypothetical protein O6933_01010 [Planctomycetota bacterium]|nr:hypothetical protein [Planctomycetota bacterium]